jgi:hypothetical protein
VEVEVAVSPRRFSVSLYQVSIPQFNAMLGNLALWLDKAAEYAATRSFDPVVLLSARLAPDQFPLVRQVQSACDTAKFAAAVLTGQEAPKHPDTEQTLPEIRARIATVRSYLEGFQPQQFQDAETRLISPGWARGASLRGEDYLVGFAIPNFYFHVSTAYAILRHNGVPLGKMDYLGKLKFA